MSQPAKSPLNVIFDDTPDHTEEEWRALGKDGKVEYEEMRHQLSAVSKAPVSSPTPLEFKGFRMKGLTGEWAVDRENIVIHLTWGPPPRLHKHRICQKIVAVLHAALPPNQRATVRAGLVGPEGGGPYTIILNGIMMRPSAESWTERKVLPALAVINPHRG